VCKQKKKVKSKTCLYFSSFQGSLKKKNLEKNSYLKTRFPAFVVFGRNYSRMENTAFEPIKLNLKNPVPSDIEVSQSVAPKHILKIAKECGIQEDELDLYGKTKAKVHLSILDRLKDRKNGKYVVVTGINPTPLGEGKSTTSIGLAQALGAHLNKKCVACLRQPSQGPTFGIKVNQKYCQSNFKGRCCWRRIFSSYSNGRIQSPLDWRHSRNYCCQQPFRFVFGQFFKRFLAAQLDARMFHEATQTDQQLFNRLCPADKKGHRSFCPIMIRRLKKLGINKENPSDLATEEMSR
jgi:hypothetical protein